ncbi:zinc-binding alcohol dehydrogenase family protein [Ligilactobacillus pobuzihii]|uniref:zinc-binding alcohol dehydrogenase family protein n=1 Tax=Ligilactobacillus pobuzihii TaxID=449659 RepID=UPI0019D1C736|nr:zinc-binding alcohol dehydrogenase family protein [Ligilactobacillus pobuzihii]MBN7273975.1 zinc-binding alcohol dehydrogenase family protein [Ligilactobacillus pobuzihii]
MPEKMNAVGFYQHLPIDDPESLVDVTLTRPTPSGHDILVQISAISVNPVDIATRKNGEDVTKKPRILGFDAVGTVVKIGPDVSLFNIGDRVYYAGSFNRPGSYSDFELVDERIVALAPDKLDDAHAAAMPLTSLTAFEAMFEQLGIDPKNLEVNHKKTILIINGAGGVGSIATQLAHYAGLHVIASASRPETKEWALQHGANEVVDHHQNLINEVHNLGYQNVDYILELNNLDNHWDEMVELIAPNGKMSSITSNQKPLNLTALKRKRVTFAWEWMFTKAFYQTDDLSSQHEILQRVAVLLDSGILRSTLNQTISGINAANLKKAHKMIEKGHTIGKIVLTK